jgi:transcription initiation factor IIE alpha subunit
VFEYMMEKYEMEEEELSEAFSFEVKFVGKIS